MDVISKRKSQARLLRTFRKIHRLTGAFLFSFFLIVAVTGLLLGWKKNSGGFILAQTFSGASTDLKDWQSLDSLREKAGRVLHEKVDPALSLNLDRIDVKPDKGMVKFIFADGYWGVQLDGATGELLHIERRRSDFIENLHDASFFDKYFKTRGEPIKLFYTSVMGCALLIFTVTGFWLWIGPKRMKKAAALPPKPAT
jgi:uncharacterized iron-regulated membrane protein